MPVTTPPTTIARRKQQRVSPTDTPNIDVMLRADCGAQAAAVCADSRRVQHQRQRLAEDVGAGARLDRLGRQMAAEGARARHARGTSRARGA